jgi:hypothetical protein
MEMRHLRRSQYTESPSTRGAPSSLGGEV